MDKKKAIIAVLAIIIILILLFFLFRSCTSQGLKVVTTEEEIYNAFVNASIEFTCNTTKDPFLINEEYSNEIYRKHRLPVDDNVKMMEILQKYANDSETLAIIQANSQDCPA